MKKIMLAVAIAASFGTVASACPIEIDAGATTIARDAHTRGHTQTSITTIMEPPQPAAPRRDLHTTAASMTVRWNTAPAQTTSDSASARMRLAPALPPLATF